MAFEREKVSVPDFGDATVIETTNHSGCIDPREPLKETVDGTFLHKINEEPGEERNPGSSAGKAMTVMAALPNLTVKEAILLVNGWENEEGRLFSTHLDTHDHSWGCGHLDKASDPAHEQLYGLPSGKVQEMQGLLLDLSQEGTLEVEAPTLQGNHHEAGILVVKTHGRPGHTVLPNIGDKPFFRFDATRHANRLDRLATYITQHSQTVVTGTQLQQRAERQREASLSLLATELPVYAVDLRNGKREAVFQRTIQPPRL